MSYVKVKDLKEQLVSMGVDEGSLRGKKRGELVEMISSLEAENAAAQLSQAGETVGKSALERLSEQATQEELSKTEESDKEKNVAEPESEEKEIEKPDPVSRLHPDEIYESDNIPYPRVMGLRRLIDEDFGIISEHSQVVQPPSIANGLIAVVHYAATLGDGTQISGCADATPENCGEDVFAGYLTAVAETRAQGRAFRFKLRISSPAFEEMKEKHIRKAGLTSDESDDGKIIQEQIRAITSLCEQHGVELDKWLAGNDKETIENLTWDEAIDLIKELNSYAVKEVPENIRKD